MTITRTCVGCRTRDTTDRLVRVVRDASGIYRTIYLATRPEAVYVLHCFQKKTQKTERRNLNLAIQRLKEIEHA